MSVFYSKRAIADLNEIYDYISLVLPNPISADSVVNGIQDTIETFKDHLLIGKPLYFDNGLFSGFRYLIYHDYLAFYHIESDNAYIDRVLYGKSDYMRILFRL